MFSSLLIEIPILQFCQSTSEFWIIWPDICMPLITWITSVLCKNRKIHCSQHLSDLKRKESSVFGTWPALVVGPSERPLSERSHQCNMWKNLCWRKRWTTSSHWWEPGGLLKWDMIWPRPPTTGHQVIMGLRNCCCCPSTVIGSDPDPQWFKVKWLSN